MAKLFKTSTEHHHIFCEKCLRKYTQKQYDNHKCDITESDDFKTTIEYLPVGEMMKTTSEQLKKQIVAPFIVYCDFESTLKKNRRRLQISKTHSKFIWCKISVFI